MPVLTREQSKKSKNFGTVDDAMATVAVPVFEVGVYVCGPNSPLGSCIIELLVHVGCQVRFSELASWDEAAERSLMGQCQVLVLCETVLASPSSKIDHARRTNLLRLAKECGIHNVLYCDYYAIQGIYVPIFQNADDGYSNSSYLSEARVAEIVAANANTSDGSSDARVNINDEINKTKGNDDATWSPGVITLKPGLLYSNIANGVGVHLYDGNVDGANHHWRRKCSSWDEQVPLVEPAFFAACVLEALVHFQERNGRTYRVHSETLAVAEIASLLSVRHPRSRARTLSFEPEIEPTSPLVVRYVENARAAGIETAALEQHVSDERERRREAPEDREEERADAVLKFFSCYGGGGAGGGGAGNGEGAADGGEEVLCPRGDAGGEAAKRYVESEEFCKSMERSFPNFWSASS